MARVAVRFDGVSTGARKAAAETRTAVKGVGDQADRDTKRISLLGPALQRTLQMATVGLTLFAGASALAFKKSIDAATSLGEAVNATRAVFKSSAADVLAWSKTTADSMGISQRAALQAAAGFGNMLNSSGVAREESAKMSKQLVQLAADMGSLNDVDPGEMLVSLRSALAGESEPLRRYGVLISEAKVQTEGLRMGLAKKGEQLNDTGKMLARYSLIMRESSAAHGDFANTADEPANAQRRLRAMLEQTAATIGTVFLPAFKSALRAVNDWLADDRNQRRLQEWAETLEDGVATALKGIAKWVRDNRAQILDLFRDAKVVVGTLADSFGRLIGTAGNSPVGLLGAASAALLLRDRLRGLAGMQITLPILLATTLVNEKNIGRVNDWINQKETLRDLLTTVGLWNEVEGRSPNDPVPGKPVGDSAADKSAIGNAARGMQLPTSQRSTHQTAGLAGFPAVDIMAQAGTPVLAPEDGRITRVTAFNPDPRYFGNGIYYVGTKTGNTYYIKHVMNPAPPGAYKKGDRIAVIARGTKNGDHAHLGIRAGGGAAGAASGPSDYEPGETSAKTSTAATGSASTKAGIDSRDLQAARGSVAFMQKRIDSIVSPTLRARTRQRANVIAELLEGITDPKEFARAKRNLAALERDFENAVKLTAATRQAQATARSIGSALGRMPEAMQRELGPRLAQIERDLGNVTGKRQLDALKKRMEEMNKIIAAGVERMRRTVELKRDAFGRAFGSVADKAMQVFDAKTEELLRLARAKVGGELLGEGALGPAGRALAAFRAARAAAERASSRSAALAGAETEEERAALVAQHALEDQEETLEKAAQAEEREIADGLERERDRIRDERAILKERFEMRLAEIRRGVDEEGRTAEWAQQQLLALLGSPEYQTDFAAAGRLIGQAFASSFAAAISGLAAAIDALRASLNTVADATGVPRELPEGGVEESWQRALRLRSEGMNKRYARFIRPSQLPGARAVSQAVAPGGAPTIVLPPVQAVFNLDGQRFAVALAQPITDEQDRIIGYRSRAL